MALKPCCATGSLHTGTPTGRIAKVQGLDCYIADAPNSSPKGIIVICADAFGWKLPNNRILADEYAKRGFTVYLPEFENGAPVAADVMDSMKALSKTGLWNQLYKVVHVAYLVRNFVPFLLYNRPAVAGPRIYNWFKAFKKAEGKDLPVGAAGFCWGGHFVTTLCHDQFKTDDGKSLIVCGFVAHPSFLSFPSDIDKVTLPYSCAAAEIDPQMSPENARKTKETLIAKSKDHGIEHEFVMYPGANHGFAVRADEDEKDQAEMGKQAEEQALEFFSKFLG